MGQLKLQLDRGQISARGAKKKRSIKYHAGWLTALACKGTLEWERRLGVWQCPKCGYREI